MKKLSVILISFILLSCEVKQNKEIVIHSDDEILIRNENLDKYIVEFNNGEIMTIGELMYLREELEYKLDYQNETIHIIRSN